LYLTIRGLQRVLGKALTSKHHAFAFLPNGCVYDQTCPIFAFDTWDAFALLQSDLHAHWALTYGASLETRPRYTPSDCFETFPFPSVFGNYDRLATVGQRFHEHRRKVMVERGEGLTKVYNRLHNPEDRANDIEALRNFHAEMNMAVVGAYGWSDLTVEHRFHDTRHGPRFTYSAEVARKIITRLQEMNNSMYLAQGSHAEPKRPKRTRRQSGTAGSPETGLFA
jgi:hypothetical protein